MAPFNWFGRTATTVEPVPPPPKRAPGDAAASGAAVGRLLGPGRLLGGRLTQDQYAASAFFATRFVLPPPSDEDDWRLESLDDQTLSRISPNRLLELLSNLSPEVSRALWDFQRFLNPGWEALARIPGTEDPSPLGQKALDAFLDTTLTDLYGGPDILLNQLGIATYLRGAILPELVLDPEGRMPIDLVAVDPAVARFRRRLDERRGPVWQLCQWQAGQLVDLDRETIRYLPVDPFPGSPYGRPMAAPAVFTSLFLLALLHDIRRVVQQQGYPRLDFSVNSEKLLAIMPAGVNADPATREAWINAAVEAIKTEYAKLAPDDAFVHLDIIDVKRPVGTVDSSSLGAVDGLIKALERLAVRALKTAPFMMASTESNTETQANRQWEAHLQGIKSIQHLSENALGRLLGLALRVQGIAATVTLTFAENRASEMLRDAQTEKLRIDNAKAKFHAGWISHEEASLEVTGHAPDNPDGPRTVAAPEPEDDGQSVDDLADINPEPGESRSPLVYVNGTTP